MRIQAAWNAIPQELQALACNKIKSKLVWDCLETLHALANYNKVTLKWVPGHKGVEGNEEADALARKGSATTVIGPEPMCGIPKSSVSLWLTRWKNKEHQSYWNHIPGQTNSKWMVKTPSKVLTDEILRLSRNQIRLVTGLITGHCHLRKHLHRMGIYLDEPICRLCNEEDEAAPHIILECPALTHWRYGLLGTENPQEVFPKKNLVKRLLNLIKVTSLFT
ncbi:hypothetical protein NQ318_022041 [Aromia moschata]|uniref:RNase H type-1 domain-containing protein n=1 Tax=Aromia moschata TaxID=1265417 RepID=A0AAV8Z567_9CUCU|nr:hypothetical protein NQ318_022041 [Aromia moschata]